MFWPYSRKRSLSPPALPLPKRQHLLDEPPSPSHALLNFDVSLSDELVLAIFYYLSPEELCLAQPVNRFWGRLATDNQLWKSLFLAENPIQRLRGSRGFSYPSSESASSSREIKPLPHRAGEGFSQDHTFRNNWKWMYRVSRNWKRGRCSTTSLNDPDLISKDPVVPTAGPSNFFSSSPFVTSNHILLAGPYAISTSSSELHFYSARDDQESRPRIITSSSLSPTSITCLALDQSQPPNASNQSQSLRLAAFESSGCFRVLSFSGSQSSRFEDLYTYSSPERRSTTLRSPIIVNAAYHHPLLIALSSSFHLSVYVLPDTPPGHHNTPLQPILKQTLHSFTSFPPSSMSLTRVSTSNTSSQYKLILTYSVPVYPEHWSLGAAEICFTVHTESQDVNLTSSRNTTALRSGWFTDPVTDEDGQVIVPADEWANKVGGVVATETDGKWVVLAGNDNTLQVYRLYRPAKLAQAISLAYIRTLYGHTAGISGLKVADGRCVSIGSEGRIRVWDLEAGWGVEVRDNDTQRDREAVRERHRKVAFDDTKIVSIGKNGVDIWRFDI